MKVTDLFAKGEFVVSAEVGPPKGCHLEGLVDEAKEFLSGISAVNSAGVQYLCPELQHSLVFTKFREDSFCP